MKKHKKILWIIGCRPNYMKLIKHKNQVVVNTGQHYDDDMATVFAKRKKMPKIKYNLGCRSMGESLDKLMQIIPKENPDYIMIMGDTNSALAGALAAAYLHIPIIHLEAGLRSYDMSMPEEINRVLIDKLSSYFLCPSQEAINNLVAENNIGNMWDIGSNICDSVLAECPTKEVEGYKQNTYRVLTLHRQSNVDNKATLKLILQALGETKERFVWPIHPRTQKRLADFGLKIPKNIEIAGPKDHKTMVSLMGLSKQVVTDSGGMQVEAYFLRKPCVTIRKETEWIETVEEGWNVVTGINKDRIKYAIKDHLPHPATHSNNSYGTGDTGEKIKDFLLNL